ncbi:hypothetical protein HYPSUDRAFT_150122 [Hypholoma sublateritium FD-334 SS-4]|uniref:RNase H type-1 domain-containing protein n=1 Tax=Hypholoma sublateritium (strain FD-334 SS-4) TaxID=945553 RepID=A0A0D2LUZ4_HYPSF|nr:hypothetical protein HYPSUDRAFT_150122 [Hypholoma sublateritium FD-334 SS-4]
MRSRRGNTYLAKVKEHAGIEGNEGADRLANIGAQCEHPDEISLEIPDQYCIRGAKFSTLTQAMLYKGIRERKMTKYKERPATELTIESVRTVVTARTNRVPSDSTIWKSIRSLDMDRKIRAFLYRALHNLQRVGKYWKKIPQHEYKATCGTCNKTESMEHIFTECVNTGQQQIWNIASQVLQSRGIDPGLKSLSNWLSAGMPNIKRPNGRAGKAKNRFFTIVMSESLYLIWLIRCEWRMEKEENELDKHTSQEIEARWKHRLNRRLRLDQAMARKKMTEWRKLNKNLVLNTWRGSLNREAQLPEDWIGEKGVLVSIEDRRPPGRNR